MKRAPDRVDGLAVASAPDALQGESSKYRGLRGEEFSNPMCPRHRFI
jgi:hypothetical protein